MRKIEFSDFCPLIVETEEAAEIEYCREEHMGESKASFTI